MVRAFRFPWILLGLLAAGCQSTGEPAPADPAGLPEGSNSLRPALKWPAFPPKGDPVGGYCPTDITYDLRIYRLEGDQLRLEDPCYARQGLAEPVHQVERPLDPKGQYVWTFRAKFRVNGSLRHTPWSETNRPPRLALVGVLPPCYAPLPVH